MKLYNKDQDIKSLRKAIFLDRDGEINKERGDYTYLLENFEILPDVIESLELFQKKNYLLIIMSNQGGIAKNVYTKADVEILHSFLLMKLRESSIHITEIYYCPHHPLKGKCLCRKPDSLLIEKSIARFNIDCGLSYFIGDKERDILAGQQAGVKSILIKPNESLLNIMEFID